MSTKRKPHQHGLATMNATRPKSKARKRRNKENARANKEAWMKEFGLVAPEAEAKTKKASPKEPTAPATKKAKPSVAPEAEPTEAAAKANKATPEKATAAASATA